VRAAPCRPATQPPARSRGRQWWRARGGHGERGTASAHAMSAPSYPWKCRRQRQRARGGLNYEVVRVAAAGPLRKDVWEKLSVSISSPGKRDGFQVGMRGAVAWWPPDVRGAGPLSLRPDAGPLSPRSNAGPPLPPSRCRPPLPPSRCRPPLPPSLAGVVQATVGPLQSPVHPWRFPACPTVRVKTCRGWRGRTLEWPPSIAIVLNSECQCLGPG
jgi:hypothetical protein